MGFSSGLPLALTFGTLSYWLAELGVSLTAIGLFGLVRASYSLKFLWSPLIDRLPIPILTRRLGPAAKLGADDPVSARPSRSSRSA